MSAPTFDQFMSALAAELAQQMGVQPGDFATPRTATPPPPEATPPAWARQSREGAEL